MKKMFILLSAIMMLAGCKEGPALKPSVSGKAGEVVIVMEKPYWEGTLGNEVRDLLAADVPYLAQKEPLYSLVNVVPSTFGDLFKVHRNIVIFTVNPQVDSNRVDYHHDVWSAPQCLIQLHAKTPEEAIELFKAKGGMIMGSIEQAERDRVIRNSKLYEETSIRAKMSDIFGGAPHFPTGYKIRKSDDTFAWIADDKDGCYQDVLIYRYPVEDAEPLSEGSVLTHMDAILKDNVPGMLDNSYMTTSKYFPVTHESIRYRGRDFMQTRGMWEVANDFMGGPFVSHSFYSQDGQDIITVLAFVYAPRFDKRQYLRQVESIIYSWEWKN